jgi:hypothetical protein
LLKYESCLVLIPFVVLMEVQSKFKASNGKSNAAQQ